MSANEICLLMELFKTPTATIGSLRAHTGLHSHQVRFASSGRRSDATGAGGGLQLVTKHERLSRLRLGWAINEDQCWYSFNFLSILESLPKVSTFTGCVRLPTSMMLTLAQLSRLSQVPLFRKQCSIADLGPEGNHKS